MRIFADLMSMMQLSSTVAMATYLFCASIAAAEEFVLDVGLVRCESFKENLSRILTNTTAAVGKPRYEPRSFPGDFLLANYDFVQAVVSCRPDGWLEGIGATYIKDRPNGEMKWKALISGMFTALNPQTSTDIAEREFLRIDRTSARLGKTVSVEGYRYVSNYRYIGDFPRFGIDPK